MRNARITQECIVNIKNEPGEGARLLSLLAEKGVNLEGFVGYGMGPDAPACMHVAAEKPDDACEVIKGAGFDCQMSECVTVEVPNEPGESAKVLRKLADAGVDVEHCYATAAGIGSGLIILRTKDNAKAVSVLK